MKRIPLVVVALMAVALLVSAGEVTNPRPVHRVHPDYTKQARGAKISGSILLRATIDEDGVPRAIQVVRPLGFGLDENTVEAFSQWRFEPAKKDGRAVARNVVAEFNFNLI